MGKSAVTNPSQATCFEGGSQAADDDAVEVRTGVTMSSVATPVPSNTMACSDPARVPSGYADGISIRIKCSRNPRLVQFIYREIIGADGVPISQPITTTGGTYQTTTDPAHPNWNTDSGGRPDPSYEAAATHRRDPDALTTFDQPGLRPGPGQTWRATFKAYAICNGHVVREITWVRSQTGSGAPSYTVSVAPASALPAWASQTLQRQGYDAAP